MRAELAAEAVLALHFLWIVWLVIGLPLGLWLGRPGFAGQASPPRRAVQASRRGLRLAHAASIMATLAMQVARYYCPLTILEEWLRGGPVYGGSWLASWLERIVYLRVSPELVMVATVLWVGLTAASFVVWPPTFRRSGQQ
jgi:hypothetical protein